MIFQLPVIPFPEASVNNIRDYDHFRGYLHSRHLRWSYGAIKNREGDDWQNRVAAKPVSDLVNTLSFAGFSGIYLNRLGYADHGSKLETELSSVLNVKPMVSDDGDLVFVDLTAYSQKLRERYSTAEWATRQERALHPLLVSWQTGFSFLEGTPDNNWRWCASECELELVNLSQQAKRVTIEMSFASGNEATLRINSPLFSEQLIIDPSGKSFSKTIVIPPGRHMISFACDARRMIAIGDPRIMVFRLINFRYRDAVD
jgi:phosphoglycerol transferase